jgi:hypothetical protein
MICVLPLLVKCKNHGNELFVCESSWIPPDADIVLVSNADKFILSLGYEEMQHGAGTSG